jgi:ABC-type transport system involved in cytochrome c biogenesis permease subunit
MSLEVGIILGILPLAFWAGRVHRRVHGPTPLKTQMKHTLIMGALLTAALLVAVAFDLTLS